MSVLMYRKCVMLYRKCGCVDEWCNHHLASIILLKLIAGTPQTAVYKVLRKKKSINEITIYIYDAYRT